MSGDKYSIIQDWKSETCYTVSAAQTLNQFLIFFNPSWQESAYKSKSYPIIIKKLLRETYQ